MHFANCAALVAVLFQGRNQGGLRGLKPPLLSQAKVEKKDKNFEFLADFVHTTLSKCHCNIIISS